MTEQELLKLKKKVEEAKTESSELRGQLKTLTSQLKKNFKCDTVKDAEDKMKVLKKDIDKLSEEIDTKIEELETKYELV